MGTRNQLLSRLSVVDLRTFFSTRSNIPLILGIATALGGLILKFDNVFTARINWDTNYYLNIGSNFIERGGLTPYMWRLDPSWNIVSGSGSGYGVLTLLLWLKTFGLSINSGHLFMYLVGLATLPVIYLLGSAWYGSKQAGIWAAIFAALSGPFMVEFWVRMDAPAVFWDCVLLWLYVYASRRNQMRWHVLLGLTTVIAVEFHILALVYVGALCFLYAIDHIKVMIQERRWWVVTPTLYFGGATAVAFTLYAVIHILPNPDIYFLIPRSCFQCTSGGLEKEISRYSTFVREFPIDTAVFLLAVGVGLWRHGAADRRYLLLVAGCLTSVTVLNPPYTSQYTGHLFPLFALGAGSLVAVPAEEPDRLRQRYWQIAQMGIVMLMLIAQANLKMQMRPRTPAMDNRRNAAAVAYIREHIPRNTVVMGPATIYSDLLDYPQFLSYPDGEHFGIYIRKENYLTFWEREKPLVYVGPIRDDPDLLQYMKEAGGFERVLPNLWISTTLLDQ